LKNSVENFNIKLTQAEEIMRQDILNYPTEQKEESLQELWGTIKRPHLHTIGAAVKENEEQETHLKK
jgi:hypothetical protein